MLFLFLFFISLSSFGMNEYERVFLEQQPRIAAAFESYQKSLKEAENRLPRLPPELFEKALFNPKTKALFENVETIQQNYIDEVMSPLCNQYSWGIPNEEALEAITHFSPLVELGAGSGYWAYLLCQKGADIIAYDNFSWESSKACKWFDVKQGTQEVLSQHQDRTLLLCWPPRDDMASQALEFFKGQRLIYIGEALHGAMADDKFFAILNQEFRQVQSIKIPNWPGYSDEVFIYERIAQ